MYRGIWFNEYRNMMEFRYCHGELPVVGQSVSVVRNRKDKATGDEKYSVTDSNTVISINDGVGRDKLIELSCDGKPVYITLPDTGISKTESDKFHYTSIIVDESKIKFDIKTLKLYYIYLHVEFEAFGIMNRTAVYKPMFGTGPEDAMNRLKQELDVSFRFGEKPVIVAGNVENYDTRSKRFKR